MSFPKSFLDELKARIRVSDVVGRKVKLIRRGREFVGMSPFSNEKSPSFTVNDDKQFWHCFSSGEHGDVIKFLEKVENLSFLEAVERLAGEAGLEMPQRDPRNVEREREAATLIDVMEMAAAFFREKLKSGAGAEARRYLDRRGLRADTIDRFGLGYSPGTDRSDRTQLMQHLKAKNITVAQMAEAGLIIHGDDIPEPYDRFRNRLMFPIADARGRVIAFGGRALDAEQKAKYLNSPETPLFHKGRGLYNLHQARKPAYDKGTVIVVEGYMDVIGMTQGGIDNAVAPLGTALTEEQIELLWRLAPEPVLCFDGDKAGLKAAFRAMQRARPMLKPGHSFRFALLPDGKDPDDVVRDEGADSLLAVLRGAKTFPEMVFNELISGERLEGADDRARLDQKLKLLIAEIKDETVQKHYRRSISGWLWNHFADVFGWRKSFHGTASEKPKFFNAESARDRRDNLLEYRFEAELLAFLLAEPRLVEIYVELLGRLNFKYQPHKSIFNEINELVVLRPNIGRDELWLALQGRGLDGRLAEIRFSVPYGFAVNNEFRDAEARLLEAVAMFMDRDQYIELNVEALRLSPDEISMSDYFERAQWIERALKTSPLAGDDSYFYKLGDYYREMMSKSEVVLEEKLRSAAAR